MFDTVRWKGSERATSEVYEAFQANSYAAKWGVADLYEWTGNALRKALEDGYDFDTGKWGAKKEIEYARIVRQGDQIKVTVWVYDDFDTEGKCELEFSVAECDVDRMMQKIENALDEAATGARKDKVENEVYEGFALGEEIDGKRVNWIETYIAPKGDGWMLDQPPGDHYHEWGWQEEGSEVPENVRDLCEAWVMTNPSESSFSVDGWMIERWKE